MKTVLRSVFYLGLSITTLVTFAPVDKVKAQQIQEDNTLGTQVTRDVLIRNILSDRIDGGTIRGGNLFHSFQELNVGEGRGVYFSNPQGISNILTRVRGSNPSNILGTLGVLGNANLFFINPRGIEFGPGARLDVGGSFFASTADSLLFDNGFEFSASNSAAPPLLTINTPIGLRFRDNPGSISNRSVVQNSDGLIIGLPFVSGQTLGLVGGNVNFDGGRITAPGARVEIGGLTASGTVGIGSDGSLNFPEGVTRGDVTLNNFSNVNVLGSGGGDIVVNAKNINLFRGSNLAVGILPGENIPNVQAGDIVINATDKLKIEGDANSPSGIQNTVSLNGFGNPGGIFINANSLEGDGNFFIASATLGQGNAGKINITADDTISLTGLQGFGSGIANTVNVSAIGDGEDITINTRSLSLSNSSQIATSILGEGNAGNIQINATDNILIDGSVLQAASFFTENGDAGNISLTTSQGSIIIEQGAIATLKQNTGSAGDIIFNAPNGSILLNNSQLISTNTSGGLAGNIKLNASELVSITSPNFLAPDGGRTIQSNGNSGSISIGNENSAPKKVELSSVFLSTTNDSVPFTIIDPVNAGDISISAVDSILVTSSEIYAFTRRRGNGGNVNLRTENGNISLTDRSIVFSTVEPGTGTNSTTITQGNAGKINVTTKNLTLTDGAQLQTLVRSGQIGNAGEITIDASGDVSFSGFANTNLRGNPEFLTSGILNVLQPEAQGNAGSVNITTDSLSLKDSAQINSSTFGNGNAGGVEIQASGDISFINNSFLSSIVGSGGEGIAGDINIKGRSLTLRGGSQIGSALLRRINDIPGGIGKPGNIDINVTDFLNISGFSPNSFSSGVFASAESGTIAKFPQEPGKINITARDFRVADGGIVNTLTFNSGNGGDIKIDANTFSATGGGQVITTARAGSGNAGNITLNISDRLTISGRDPNFNQRFLEVVDNQGPESGIFANTAPGSTGNGGSIFIVPKQVTIKNGGTVAVTSDGTGKAGNLELEADNLTLDAGTITARSSAASGGNINLNIKDVLLLRRASEISASAGIGEGTGDGGNININTGVLVALPKENSDITANAVNDSGGRIDIQADSILGIEPLSREELAIRDPDELNPRNLPSSDITAISQGNPNLDGQVSITTPDVDPGDDLVELPENVTDPREQIAQNPCKQGVGSEFVQIGRGGLPTSPNQTFSSSTVRVGLVNPVDSTARSDQKINVSQNSTQKRIVPAQGWVFNQEGEVVLTAYNPKDINIQRVNKTSAICSGH